MKEELAPDARTPEEKLKAATEELTMKVRERDGASQPRPLSAFSSCLSMPNDQPSAAPVCLSGQAEHEARQAALAGYREALLATSMADTEKVCLAVRLSVWLAGCLPVRLSGFLSGWLAGWLAGWLHVRPPPVFSPPLAAAHAASSLPLLN